MFVLLGVFLLSSVLFYFIIVRIYAPNANIEKRLSYIEGIHSQETQVEEKKSFSQRVIDSFLRKLKSIIDRFASKGLQEDLEDRLSLANYPFGLSVNGWLMARLGISILLPSFFLLLISNSHKPFAFNMLIFITFAAICWIYPNVYLRRKVRLKNQRVARQLPDVLDLLTVSVEAGLSFDGAIAKVVEKSKGEISLEFKNVLSEMELGKSRRDALSNMTRRCDIPDIKTFISSIIQADQLGVSIGKILRIQSAQIRDKRRQRAREEAMKAPVKMLFPLVFFIFPTLFVVILGPAIIQISQTLFK